MKEESESKEKNVSRERKYLRKGTARECQKKKGQGKREQGVVYDLS